MYSTCICMHGQGSASEVVGLFHYIGFRACGWSEAPPRRDVPDYVLDCVEVYVYFGGT